MRSTGTRICKICGKEYEYCKTKARGAFRWQDVACCEEHANQYFRAIAISRGELIPEETKQKEKEETDPLFNKKPSAKKYKKIEEKKDE